MRGVELLTANAVALALGLLLFFIFRPPHGLPVAAVLLTGLLVVQLQQSRRPPATTSVRSSVMRLFALILNGLYGSFFALLAYYMILALTRQIGYPYE